MDDSKAFMMCETADNKREGNICLHSDEFLE